MAKESNHICKDSKTDTNSDFFNACWESIVLKLIDVMLFPTFIYFFNWELSYIRAEFYFIQAGITLLASILCFGLSKIIDLLHIMSKK